MYDVGLPANSRSVPYVRCTNKIILEPFLHSHMNYYPPKINSTIIFELNFYFLK
jgi:hypothetical protein